MKSKHARAFTYLLCGLALCWAASYAIPATADDAGQLYLRGYQSKFEAEQLEKAGHTAAALLRYEEALKIVESVAKDFPAWQPEIVKFRLEKLREKIAQLKGAQAAPAPTQPAPQTFVIPPSTPPLITNSLEPGVYVSGMAGTCLILVPKLENNGSTFDKIAPPNISSNDTPYKLRRMTPDLTLKRIDSLAAPQPVR